MKRLWMISFLGLVALSLTGCLSHWFLDSSSRLQVENATEDCTLVGLDIMSQEGSYRTWIHEKILPGERSRVVEEDWVGEFKIRIRYTKSTDGSGKQLQLVRSVELDGGSLYMVVKNQGDSLAYRFK